MYSDLQLMTIIGLVQANFQGMRGCQDIVHVVIFFDRGGVLEGCTTIGVAMGYKVVANNSGLGLHPFLRS